MFRAWLFVVALYRARGELLILDGKFAGLSAPSVLYAISATPFDVTAQLVATDDTEWSHASCPPKYVGPEQLEGKLVIVRNQRLTCSRKQLSMTLIELGAVGSISIQSRTTGVLPQVAGKDYYSRGPGETLEPLSLPQTNVAGPLIDNVYLELRTGAIIRARMTPSRNVWVEIWTSVWWAIWQAALTIQSVIVLELALLRLYAYVREDKWPRPTIPQTLLFIESVAHAQRIAYFAVDPYWSRGIYTEDVNAWLLTNNLALASVGRAQFLVYFTQAAALSGIATNSVARPFWAATLLVTCFLLLVGDIFASAFVLNHWLLVIVRALLWTTIMPGIELALYIIAYHQVLRKLSNLPPSLLNKIKLVMRNTCFICAIQVLFGVMMMASLGNPLALLFVLFGFRSAVNAASYVQVTVFKPLSVPVPGGPVGFIVGMLFGALRVVTNCACFGPGSIKYTIKVPENDIPACSQVLPLPTDAQPVAEEAPDWLHLGISLRFAQEHISVFELGEHQSAVDLGKLMHISFKSLRGAGSLSAVELYHDARTLDGSRAVGEATVFVDHDPEAHLIDIVAALRSYLEQHKLDPQNTFFWLAAFSRRRLPLAERQLRIKKPQKHRPADFFLNRWDWDTSFKLLLIQESHCNCAFDAHLRTILKEYECVLSGIPVKPRDPFHFQSLPAVHGMRFDGVKPHGLSEHPNKTEQHSITPLAPLVAVLDGELESVANQQVREGKTYYLLRYSAA